MTYNANSLSHSVTGQVLLEASANGSVVSVQSDDLSPDGANARLQVGLLWDGGAGLGLVHVSASLADVERAVSPLAASVNLFVRKCEFPINWEILVGK